MLGKGSVGRWFSVRGGVSEPLPDTSTDPNCLLLKLSYT